MMASGSEPVRTADGAARSRDAAVDIERPLWQCPSQHCGRHRSRQSSRCESN